MSASDEAPTGPFLVVSAHAGDFVWRAGGAIALASVPRRCGDRALPQLSASAAESARAWREGRKLDEIKAIRREEAIQGGRGARGRDRVP